MSMGWIKVRVDLATHPKVVGLAVRLKVPRLQVVGGLYAVWCVLDAHSINGELPGYTLAVLDEAIGWPGFAAAMADVGWLQATEQGLVAPRYEEHNGSTAKRRALDGARKRDERAALRATIEVLNTSRINADKGVTRKEEEEEERPTPLPPVPDGQGEQGRDASPSDAGAAGKEQAEPARKRKPPPVGIKAWLARCTAEGVKPVPEGCAALAYAQQAGIPPEILAMHWREFKTRHAESGKQYADWMKVLVNSLRGNWYGLWLMQPNGTCTLSTKGVQAQRVQAALKGETGDSP